MKFLIQIVIVLSAATAVSAQVPSSKTALDDLKFLIGDWEAVGGGDPGVGKGGFSFTLDLQSKIIIRRSYADYPATTNRPAMRHDDLMVIYFDESAHQTFANFFDTEGHQIKYRVTTSADRQSVVFMSEPVQSQPRYRLSYTASRDGNLNGTFDIAPPGQPETFKNYLQWTGRKK
jgi:hypothetical protein